jgi:hypothetical protein
MSTVIIFTILPSLELETWERINFGNKELHD